MRGEEHAWKPETVAALQHAVRGNSPDKYRAFARRINEQSERLLTIRGLFRFKSPSEMARRRCRSTKSSRPAEIVKRFATGAM